MSASSPQNRANKLLDCFSGGDDADLAGCHRPFFDTGPLLELQGPVRRALEITHLGRVWASALALVRWTCVST